MRESAVFLLPVYNLMSPSCSSTQIFLLRRGNFGESAINKRYIAYFSLRFPKWRENFGDSRTFKADIRLLNICMGFQDLLSQNGGFGGQNRGRGGAILTPNELVLTFRGSYVCANFGENLSRNATVRVPTDGQTHTQTHRRKPIL